MGFPVHQAAHKFTRGTPIVYTNGRWVSTSGAWDAVVDSIQSADIFTATDSGTIDYPFGTVTPGELVKTSSGTSIGRIVSPGKLLLDRTGSSTSTTIVNQAKQNNPTLSDLGGQPLSTVLTTLSNLSPGDGYLQGASTGTLQWSFPSLRTEIQTLTALQTTITVTVITTDGIAVYIEGAREDEFAILNSTQIQLFRSYPAGTKVYLTQNDFSGSGTAIAPYGPASGDLGGMFPNPTVKQVHAVNKAFTYNIDGTLATMTDANGSKTFTYTLGKLTSVSGTGVYQNKTMTYSGDQLVSVTVT
jgi:hypothetical protein